MDRRRERRRDRGGGGRGGAGGERGCPSGDGSGDRRRRAGGVWLDRRRAGGQRRAPARPTLGGCGGGSERGGGGQATTSVALGTKDIASPQTFPVRRPNPSRGLISRTGTACRERVPQEQARERAIGPPRLADLRQLGRVGKRVERRSGPSLPADPEVADREYVGSAEVEHQEHVRAPLADPLDRGQLGDHVRRRAASRAGPARASRRARARPVSAGRRSSRATARPRSAAHRGRPRAPRRASAGDRQTVPSVDRRWRRRPRRQLLTDDRADERGIVVGRNRYLRRSRKIASTSEGVDQVAQHRIGGAQVLDRRARRACSSGREASAQRRRARRARARPSTRCT